MLLAKDCVKVNTGYTINSIILYTFWYAKLSGVMCFKSYLLKIIKYFCRSYAATFDKFVLILILILLTIVAVAAVG